MDNIICIVAAGGYASRMGIVEPKPMITVEGKTLLEYTLTSLKNAGLKKIFVFSNRNDFFNQQYKIVQKFSGVKILKDEKISSTIELLYMTREMSKSEKYLFCYGNAPRSNDVYKSMLSCKDNLGAISLKNSSRRDLIDNKKKVLEPPFFINEKILKESDHYKKWSQLFNDGQCKYCLDMFNAPQEFNNHIEWYKYRRYIYDYVIHDSWPNKTFNADSLMLAG